MTRKPDRTDYIAKVFTRKDGDTSRKVVSFDRSNRNPDGTWTNIEALYIQYADGEQVPLRGPATLKALKEPKGNYIENIFINRWDDEKQDEPPNPEDFDDNPFR